MKMIGHQAESLNFCNRANVFSKPFKEKTIVFILTKNQIITVPVIINMVNGIWLKRLSWICHVFLISICLTSNYMDLNEIRNVLLRHCGSYVFELAMLFKCNSIELMKSCLYHYSSMFLGYHSFNLSWGILENSFVFRVTNVPLFATTIEAINRSLGPTMFPEDTEANLSSAYVSEKSGV